MKKIATISGFVFLWMSCSLEKEAVRPSQEADGVRVGSLEENPSDSEAATGVAVDESSHYFQDYIWPILKQNCLGCHNETFRGFQASPHGFAFIRSEQTQSLLKNKEVFSEFAKLRSENLPLPVSKSKGGSGHGGGVPLPGNSEDFKSFKLHVLEFLSLLSQEQQRTLTEGNVVSDSPGPSTEHTDHQLRLIFQNEIWHILKSRCLSCHVQDGMAKHSGLILDGPSDVLKLFLSLSMIRTTQNLPLTVAKSADLETHGGQRVLDPDSSEFLSFSESVQRLVDRYAETGDTLPVSESYKPNDRGSNDTPPDEIDVSQEISDYFSKNLMPVFSKGDCFRCHESGRTMSGFQLSRDLQDIQINVNYFAKFSLQTHRGVPVPVAKSAGWKSHGGGQIFVSGSDDYQMFLSHTRQINKLILELKNLDIHHFFADAILKDPYLIARKAMMELGGRLPTLAERDALRTGGFPALDKLLDHLLGGEEFYNWMDTVWEDYYFTNYWWFVNLFDRGRMPNFSASAHKDLTGDAASAIRGTARAGALATPMQDTPLDFVRFVLEDGYDPENPEKKIRPFTEIVNGRYMVANAFTAKVYGREVFATGEKDPNVDKYTITQTRFTTDHYQNQYVPDPELFPGERRIRNPFTDFFPIHKVVSTPMFDSGRYRSGAVEMSVSGLLTDPGFLAIYPSSQTNANRSRAAFIFKVFLDTDILELGVPPSGTEKTYPNPTMDHPDCISCHKVMDPVAGLFKNWGGTYGRFLDPDGPFPRHNQKPWRSDMRAPGYSEAEPYDPENSSGPRGKPLSPVQWLGEKIAQDDRFLSAMVRLMFKSLVGRVFKDSDPDVDHEEMIIFNKFIETLGLKFREKNYNLRYVIKEIIKSPYYCADHESSKQFTTLGQGRLLNPENLFNKFSALLNGVSGRTLTPGELLGSYRILYGGIDGNHTRTRNSKINAVMANIQLRLALKYSVEMGKDFASDPDKRKFFPFGNEVSVKGQDGYLLNPDRPPLDPDSDEARLVINRIKRNIVHLYEVLHGRTYGSDHPRVNETYSLFKKIYDVTSNDQNKSVSWDGRWTTPRIRTDDSGVMRAWVGVGAALISDYHFFYD